MADYRALPSPFPRTAAVGVREIIDGFFRRKRILIPLFLLVFLGAAAYLVFSRPIWEAETTLLVKSNRTDLVMSPENGTEQTRAETTEAEIATEVQLLGSRELLRQVVLNAHLAPDNSEPAIDKAVAKLASKLKISPVLRSDMIQVKYSSHDPQQTALVLRTLSDAYMERHLQLHSNPASYDFFSQQADLYARQLQQAHDKLLAFQQKTKIVLLPEQKDIVLRKLLDLQSSIRDAEATRRETEKKMRDLTGQIDHMNPRITTQSRRLPNQESVEKLNTMLVELQNKRTEALVKFRPEDRIIRELDQQIANTRAALERAGSMEATEEATDVNPLRQNLETDLAHAEAQETGLNGRLEELSKQVLDYRGQLDQLESGTSDDQNLMREVKEAEDNYLLYARKREEARIAHALDVRKVANVAVVDPPRVPAVPLSKLRPPVVAAFFLSNMLILVGAYISDRLRRFVNTPSEAEVVSGLAVLGTVPYRALPAGHACMIGESQ